MINLINEELSAFHKLEIFKSNYQAGFWRQEVLCQKYSFVLDY
jgi:hypothetical protein